MKATNNEQLRNELLEQFDKLVNREVKSRDAKVMGYIAGKIIQSAATELVYNDLQGNDKIIEFFETAQPKRGRPRKK